MTDAETLSNGALSEVEPKENDPIISPLEAFAASQLAVSRLFQPLLFDLDTASPEWRQRLGDLADAIAVHTIRITMEEGINQGAIALNALHATGGIDTHIERLHTAIFAEGLRIQDSSRYMFEGSPEASLDHGAKMLLPFLRRVLSGESGLSIKSAFGGLSHEEEKTLAEKLFAGLVVAYGDSTFLGTRSEVSDDARGAMVQAISEGDFKTAAHAAVDMHVALCETILHPAKVSLAHGNDEVSIGISRILPFAKEKAPEVQKVCLKMLREADLATVTDAVVLSLGQFTKKDRAHHPDRYVKAQMLLENLSEVLYGTRENVSFVVKHLQKFITKVDTAFKNEGGKSDDVSLFRSLSLRDRAGVVALILHQTDDIRGKLLLISENPEIIHTLEALQDTSLGRKIAEGWRGALVASNTSVNAIQSVLEVQHSLTDMAFAYVVDKFKPHEPGSHGALKGKSHVKRNMGLLALIGVALTTASCGTAQPSAVDHSPTPPPDSPTSHSTDTATATLTATSSSTPTATIVPTPSPILSLEQFKLNAIINGATDDDFKGLTGPDASGHLKFRTDLQDLVTQLQAGRDVSGDPRFSVLQQTKAWNELKKLCGPGSDCVVRSSIFKGDASNPFRIAHFIDLGDKILFLGLHPNFQVNTNTTQLLPKLVAPSGEKLIPYEVFDFGLTTSGCSLVPSDKNPASRFVFAGKDKRIIAYQTYFGNGFAQIVVIDHYAFFGEKNKGDFPDVCGKAFAIGNDEKTGTTFGAYYEVKDGVIDYAQAMNAAGNFGIARLEFGTWVWHLDPTKTPTSSKTPTQTPTPTRTQTFTPSPTNTLTLTPSQTATFTKTFTPTVTLAATLSLPDLTSGFEKDLNGQGDKMIYECSTKSSHAMTKAINMVKNLREKFNDEGKDLDEFLSKISNARIFSPFGIDANSGSPQAIVVEQDALFVGALSFVSDQSPWSEVRGINSQVKFSCGIYLTPDDPKTPVIIVNQISLDESGRITEVMITGPSSIKRYPSEGGVAVISRVIGWSGIDVADLIKSGVPTPNPINKPTFGYSGRESEIIFRKLGIIGSQKLINAGITSELVDRVLKSQILQFLYRVRPR